MRIYLVLSGVLVAGGTTIGYFFPDTFSLAGYFVGAVLLIFAAIVLLVVRREEATGIRQ